MPPFEPALAEDLSDANLARLLAADARSASQKYSTQGLSALIGGRSSPKVKPNTRFLKNLVKNADTHNDRLKRKEDAERQEKLRKFEEQDAERMRSDRRDKRGGEDGREKKRRKLSEGNSKHRQESSKHRDRVREKHSRRKRRQRKNTSSGSSRSPSPSTTRTRDRAEDRSKVEHRKRRKRRDHTASESDNDDDKKHRSHYKLTRRRGSTVGNLPKDEIDKSDVSKRKSHERQEPDLASDDPLDTLLDNKYLSQPRSRMDAHFSAHYDPKQDTNPDSGDDSDWDRALNAMRDRSNFQRAQASRMLAAGFSDEQVKKWETTSSRPNNGETKDAKDLKWKAKGEEREWDKGKPLLGEHIVFSDSEDEIKDEHKLSQKRLDKKTGTGGGWKKSGGLLKGFKNALGP